MPRVYYHQNASHDWPSDGEPPKGSVEIVRHPEPGERVDPKTGAITLDAALEADMKADPRAVERAHAQKAIEAVLILSGVELKAGLLFAEADALGLDLRELAATVEAKARQATEAEIARRVAKSGG